LLIVSYNSYARGIRTHLEIIVGFNLRGHPKAANEGQLKTGQR